MHGAHDRRPVHAFWFPSGLSAPAWRARRPRTCARDPTTVVEIPSPSTAGADPSSTMDEYPALPSLRHHLVLHQDAPRARLWSRADPPPPAGGGAWRYDLVAGEAAVVPLGAIGTTLPSAELYADLPPEDGA